MLYPNLIVCQLTGHVTCLSHSPRVHHPPELSTEAKRAVGRRAARHPLAPGEQGSARWQLALRELPLGVGQQLAPECPAPGGQSALGLLADRGHPRGTIRPR